MKAGGLFPIALGAIFIAGCSGGSSPSPQEERFGTTLFGVCTAASADRKSDPRGILNGTPDNRCGARGAVALFPAKANSSQEIFCSGTLIEQDIVLTAAHCLSAGTLRENGNSFLAGTSGVLPVQAIDYFAHPGYSAQSNAYDLGVILLRVPMDSSVAPIALASSTPSEGTAGYAVGYGLDGQGSDGNGNVGARKYAVLTVSNQYSESGSYDADSFLALTSANQQTCGGDSGGPFLVNGLIAGVLSGGDYGDNANQTCVSALNSLYNSVGHFRSWIAQAIATLRSRH